VADVVRFQAPGERSEAASAEVRAPRAATKMSVEISHGSSNPSGGSVLN